MAQYPTQLVTRCDSETGEVYVVSEHGDGTVTWMMPLKLTAQVMDHRGNRTLVETDGRCCVSPGADTPIIGYILNGSDAWQYVCTPCQNMRYLWATCTKFPVILSLDGGMCTHLAVHNDTTPVFPGVMLTPGVGVYAMNGVAGFNFGSLRVAVW